jgi:hypothetical protein
MSGNLMHSPHLLTTVPSSDDEEISEKLGPAIEASERLQLVLFGDDRPVMEEGTLHFGPELKRNAYFR